MVFVALLLLPAASARAVILVTSCGQRLPAGETGDLVNDLVCTDGGSAMALDGGATLNLNGFTIRGHGRGVGISCFGRGGRRQQLCTVNGPGEITGFEAGISGGGCRFVARNLTVSRNKHGIYIPKSCDLDAANVAASENGELGIWATNVRGQALEVNRNGGGGLVASRGLDVRELRATENGREGVRVARFRGNGGRIATSTITGNDRLGAGFDIAAAGRLRLIGTTCGRSARLRYRRNPASNFYQPRVVGSFGCAGD